MIILFAPEMLENKTCSKLMDVDLFRLLKLSRALPVHVWFEIILRSYEMQPQYSKQLDEAVCCCSAAYATL